MTYIVYILILSFILVLDIGLVATLDKYVAPWESEKVIIHIAKLLAAPIYLLIMGFQQISNYAFNTKYEL